MKKYIYIFGFWCCIFNISFAACKTQQAAEKHQPANQEAPANMPTSGRLHEEPISSIEKDTNIAENTKTSSSISNERFILEEEKAVQKDTPSLSISESYTQIPKAVPEKTVASPALETEEDDPAAEYSTDSAELAPAVQAETAAAEGKNASEPVPDAVEAFTAAPEHMADSGYSMSIESPPEQKPQADILSDVPADIPVMHPDTAAVQPNVVAMKSGSAAIQSNTVVIHSDDVTAEPDTVSTPPEQTYEDTLADIITDFEDQDGEREYEPYYTFHEEMLNLFSPHIFSVALSKEPENERKVTVSRTAAVEEKQRLEIVYPGHGWVYVGEQTSQRGLRYEQRKLQENTSVFTFTAEKAGNYILHFSYFDVFTDDFITDAIAVSVNTAKTSIPKTMIRAPEYKSTAAAAEETNSKPENQKNTASDIRHQNTDVSSPMAAENKVEQNPVSETAHSMEKKEMVNEPTLELSSVMENEEMPAPAQLLEQARTAIAAAHAAKALQYLDTFFMTAINNLDEGWFLRGQAYELNGTTRNIRLAFDAYKTLTEAFPQSKYWTEADARLRYIKNFYINIQ